MKFMIDVYTFFMRENYRWGIERVGGRGKRGGEENPYDSREKGCERYGTCLRYSLLLNQSNKNKLCRKTFQKNTNKVENYKYATNINRIPCE